MQVADVNVGQLIIAGGVGAIGVMQTIILAKFRKIDTLAESVVKLESWAYGPNRDNGKNKEINDMKADVDILTADVAELFGERRSGDDRRRA